MSELFNMGDLKETIGLGITSEFISDKLNIEPDEKEKRSCRYEHDTVVRILDSLIAHLRIIRDEETFVHADRPEKAAKKTPATTTDEEPW